MSPCLISRNGRSLPIQESGLENRNLFTSRWSPTRRLSSMEGVGILNACTTNVVPNSARITVTTRLSKYSRSVDCIGSRHRQNIQGQSGSFLLSTLLAVTLSFSHPLAVDLELNQKDLAMVRPCFP